MPSLFFYLFSFTLIFSALAVIISRNPLYNVLALVVAIFSLSSLFILMEAFFVGIILLMVYAGAVLIFFLFVVMCLNLNVPAITTAKQNRFRLLGGLAGLMFLAEFLMALNSFVIAHSSMPVTTVPGSIEQVGRILFTEYLLPFELTSILLLVALLGIVSLAQGAFNPKEEQSP